MSNITNKSIDQNTFLLEKLVDDLGKVFDERMERIHLKLEQVNRERNRCNYHGKEQYAQGVILAQIAQRPVSRVNQGSIRYQSSNDIKQEILASLRYSSGPI